MSGNLAYSASNAEIFTLHFHLFPAQVRAISMWPTEPCCGMTLPCPASMIMGKMNKSYSDVIVSPCDDDKFSPNFTSGSP